MEKNALDHVEEIKDDEEERHPHLNGIELQALEIHSKTIHPNRGKERLNWGAWFSKHF